MKVKQYHKPIFRHRGWVSLDDNNFVYVGQLRIARYIPERRVLEFRDPRTSRKVAPRIIEVPLIDFARSLRMIE